MIKIEHEDLKQFLEPIVWSDTKNGYNAVFKEDLVGIVNSSVEVRCGGPTDFALLNRVQESDKGAGFKSWTKKTKVDGYSFVREIPVLEWKILNWQDMPKSINPVGTGKAKYIECMSDRILVGGLPYHLNESSQYATLYQNSTIRGFLNGINVEDAKNMNERWFLEGGGDFKKFGISFLNSAFSDISCEIKIEKETGEIKYSKKRARGYGLKLKKNISVEEQIKYYINSGKSVFDSAWVGNDDERALIISALGSKVQMTF